MYGIRGFGRGGHRPPPGSEAIASAKQFSLRRIGRHFFPFFLRQRKRILLGSICLVITIALGKAPPLLTRYLVDQVLLPFQKVPWTAERYQTALGLGALVVGAMVLIAAGNYIFSSIRIRVIREAGITLVRDIRQHVYSHLQKLSLRYYDSTQTGEVMSRLTGDVDAIERFFGSVSDRLIVNILNLMITVVIIFYLNWRLALVALIPVPVLVSVMLHFSRKVRPVFRQIRDRMGEIHAKLQDNISGIRVIRAFNREPEEMERFSEKNESFYQSQRQGVNLFSRFFPLIHFIDGSGMILVTAVGGWMLLQRDSQLTIGDLFAFNAFVIQLYQPIGVLFQSYASVLQTGASAERVAELLEEEPDVADDPDAVDLPPVQGEVRFEQVGFHY
ncbi:MAG: ABC transporter ATP-binding protein, partial [Lentisphaerae bacterium]